VREGFDRLDLGTAQLAEDLAVLEVAAEGAEGDAEAGGDVGRGRAAGEELHGLLAAQARRGADEGGHGVTSPIGSEHVSYTS